MQLGAGLRAGLLHVILADIAGWLTVRGDGVRETGTAAALSAQSR
jgi:hypothetical protein